jgi:hypothetical protein
MYARRSTVLPPSVRAVELAFQADEDHGEDVLFAGRVADDPNRSPGLAVGVGSYVIASGSAIASSACATVISRTAIFSIVSSGQITSTVTGYYGRNTLSPVNPALT